MNVLRTTLACICALALAAVDVGAQDGSSTAGLSRTRRLAELGHLPKPSTVLVDHIINYHRHGIARPRAGESVAVECRWDRPPSIGLGRSVLQIGLATPELHDLTHARPLNLAIVVDCSSSMAAGDKMSRVRAALNRFSRSLRPTDRVAVVTYSTDAEVALEPMPFRDGARFRAVVATLEPHLNTNLHAGLMLGYRVVARHFDRACTNRVILLTDGLANTGVTDPAQIASESARMNARAIDLSTIGVGVNLDQDLLRRLAKAGRGLFHFIGDAEDLTKVFDAEVQSLMGAVARRVSLHLTCAPDVAIDRIYGYTPMRDEHGVRIDLDDFNYGMTNVVVLEVRDDSAERRARVDVRLVYEDAARGDRQCVERTTRSPVVSTASTHDREVRKNYTIAVMARALHTMAVSAEGRRYGEAERAVKGALDLVRRTYPATQDVDLVRTRGMLERYRTILAGHVERFRGL